MGSYSETEIENLKEFLVLEKDEVVDAEILEVEIVPGFKGKGKQFNLSFRAVRGDHEGSVLTTTFVHAAVVVGWLKAPTSEGGLEMSIPTVTKLVNYGEGVSNLIGKVVSLTAKKPKDNYNKLAKIVTLQL